MKIKNFTAIVVPIAIFLTSFYIKSTQDQNFPTVTQIQAQSAVETQIPQPTPSPKPKPVNTHPIPNIQAKAFQVYDLNTDTILVEYNPQQPLPPASTTKIMTAIVALENYSLSEIITVPNIKIPGATVDLFPGEKVTVENLLYGLLLPSGNNVATILAQHFPGGEAQFVQAMNKKANQLELEETNFVNPHGLHHPLHLTSASDLTALAEYAINNPKFSQIVSSKNKTITSIDQQSSHHLKNLNQLLFTVEGVKGIKTGWTEQAGESLVTLVDQQNHPIIITILGSQDRFNHTKLLIDWVYTYTQW